jgi:glycosyltransferase involved in cell wall biosynthesis
LIGYVGNLSSRIDIDLLDHVARTRPRWQLVLLGSTHVSRSVLRLREHPNVHFLGVKAYPKVRRYIAAFDVALVPHLDDAMTQSMNPLKVFVYASLGVPIVSTAVSNVDELRPLIRSASTPDGFVQAVEEALRAGHGVTPEGRQLLTEHSWVRRVEHILDLLDETLTGKGVRLTSTR